jgi:hypothetical protein
LKLIKKTYKYENYKFIKINNSYYIDGVGASTYKSITFNLDEVLKDYYLLGKKLFLKVEGIESFTNIFIKSNKKYNIVLLPYSPSTLNNYEKNNNFVFTLQNVDLNEDIEPNKNGIIEIRNYEKLINNIEVKNLLLDFCRKYGMPYYENLEEDIILEGNHSQYPLTIKIKDFLLTSITIYLLSELDRIVEQKESDINLNNLIKIMTLPPKSNYEDIKKRIDLYRSNFEEYYKVELSCYKGYSTTIFPLLNEKNTIETINLVQALAYYYLVKENGKSAFCMKCGKLVKDLKSGVCEECYNDDPYYKNNTKRRELNKIHTALKEKLLSMNNTEINEKIKKDPYNIHSPKEKYLNYLYNLCKEYNLL